MSINLSVHQLQSKNLVDRLQQIIRDTALDPQCLILEITETVRIEPTEILRKNLLKLKSQDFHLSLDDFGSGYASMTYLQQLPAKSIKLEQSFIRAMQDDFKTQEIVKSIIALAHRLQLKVVAEGIEQPQQVAQLRLWGCDFGQGYLFGRPHSHQVTEDSLLGRLLPGHSLDCLKPMP